MAIVFVQSANGKDSNVSTTAATAAINTTGGNALLIGLTWYAGSGGGTAHFVSCTDNDSGTTPLNDVSVNSGSDTNSRIYSKFKITAKIGYIATITLDIIGYKSICVAEVSGIASMHTTSYDKFATGTTTATTATLSTANQFAFGLCGSTETPNALSMSAGWTVDQNTEDATTSSNTMIGHQIVSVNTALTLSNGATNQPTVLIATYEATLTVPFCIQGVINQTATIGADLLKRSNTDTWSARLSFRFDGTAGGNPSVLFTNVLNNGANPGYEAYIEETTQKVRVRIINSITAPNYLGRTGGTVVSDSTWRVLFITYDGSSTAAGVKIYLAGVLETMATEADSLSLTSSTAGQQMFFCSQLGRESTYYLNGAMRGMMIWSDVKSQAFISANSDINVLPVADGNTLLRLAFSEGSGLTAADTGGAGDTATLTSSAMWNGTPAVAPLSLLSGGGDIGTIRSPLTIVSSAINILSRDRGIRWRDR